MTEPWVVPHDLYLLSVAGLVRMVEAVGSPTFRDWMARQAARSVYIVRQSKRTRARARIARELGQVSAGDLERLVYEMLIWTWRDTFMLCRVDARGEIETAETVGLEHIRAALAQGKGAILLESSFFGQRHAAKRILAAQGWLADQTHAARHVGGLASSTLTRFQAGVIRPFFERREKQFVAKVVTIERESLAFTRRMAEQLAQNRLLYIAGEGSFGKKFVDCKFLGKPRPFATGAHSLSQWTGAPLLPLFCFYTQGKLKLEVAPPLSRGGFKDPARVMGAYAQQLEQHIRQYPEQYRNWSELQ